MPIIKGGYVGEYIGSYYSIVDSIGFRDLGLGSKLLKGGCIEGTLIGVRKSDTKHYTGDYIGFRI